MPSFNISGVEVKGNHKTSLAVFEKELEKSLQSSNINELRRHLKDATSRLKASGYFSGLKTSIEVISESEKQATVKVVVNVNEKSVQVSKCEVIGNQKTNISIFNRELDKLSHTSAVYELHHTLHEATERLQRMNAFKDVDAEVKVISESRSHANVNVVVKVKEKNMPSLKGETFFGNEGNNVGGSLQGSLHNISGHGDMLKLSYGTNNAGSKDTTLMYTIPSISKNLYSMDCSVRVYDDNSFASFSSFYKNALSASLSINSMDRSRSLTLESVVRDEVPVSMSAAATTSVHSLMDAKKMTAYNSPGLFGLFQGVGAVTKHTSPAVLALLSPSSKTSITYSHKVDSRDSSAHPSKGGFLSSMFELALPPGTAQYVRGEVALEKHTTILSSKRNPRLSIVGSLCGSFASTRVIDFSSFNQPFNSDNDGVYANKYGERKMCHLSDRYYLGGPMSMRGINLKGAGPRSFRPVLDNKSGSDAGDALGGLTKITALAALSSHLPFSYEVAQSMKTMVFINGAAILPHSVFPLAHPSTLLSNDIFSYLRLSVGAGISYGMGPVRLELTYAVPFLSSTHDNHKAFQIGVAMGMNST